jgi:predicted dehydrogenase
MASSIGVGVIGTGFMGAAHAQSFLAVPHIFETALKPRLVVVADINLPAAQAAAQRYGFGRATADWKDVIADPAVEVVSITVPNALHAEIALAAIQAGKHVYCEKPLAATAEAAEAMGAAAAKSPVKTLVGYNYARSPAVVYARDLIAQGVIGEPIYWRGVCDEDYMADADTPFSWRCRRDTAGFGALGDLASHLVSVARMLMGPIARVVADQRTVIAERPVPGAGEAAEKRSGEVKRDRSRPAQRVENEDTAHALLQFSGGVMGSLVTSRAHWGRKNHLAFEVFGRKGSILFDHERMNEIQLFTKDGIDGATNGFRTILIGPEHPSYGRFSPARGHGLGFNDLKIIEIAHLLQGIAGEETLFPTIRDALQIERILHAIVRSAEAEQWIDTNDR